MSAPDPRLREVTLLTSDGLRWETEALSASDFDQTLYEHRNIAVRAPGTSEAAWRVMTRQVVAFRVDDSVSGAAVEGIETP